MVKGENPNTPGPGDKDKNTNGDQTTERPEFKQLYTIEIVSELGMTIYGHADSEDEI